MATVSQAIYINPTIAAQSISAVTATAQAATYTVPANSYAILTFDLIQNSAGPGVGSYSITVPGLTVQNSLPLTLNNPQRGIYVPANAVITITVAAPGGTGPTQAILYGVVFTNG